jgi:hypothetical protein
VPTADEIQRNASIISNEAASPTKYAGFCGFSHYDHQLADSSANGSSHITDISEARTIIDHPGRCSRHTPYYTNGSQPATIRALRSMLFNMN